MKLLSILSVAAPLLLDTSLAAVPAKKQPTAELETTQWFIPQSEPLLLARSMRRKIFGSARAASPGGSDLNKNKGSISHPPTNDKKETQPKKEVAPQKTDKTGPTTNAQKKTEEKKAVAQQPKKAVAQQSKKAVAEHPQQAQHAAKPAKPAKQNIKDGGGSKSSSSSGSPKAKGSSKNSKSKDSPKTPTAKNTSKTPKAKDSVKNSKAKDNPKHSGPKDSSKISKIKESPKTAKAKDSLKNSKTKDDLKKSKAKDSPKTPKAKDSPQTPKAKDSSKTLKAKGSPKPEASKAKSNKAKTLNGSSPKSPKTPGAPPRIVDTTRKSEYERLRPKPGGKQPEKGSNDGKASPAHKSGKSVNKDGRKADRKTDKKVSGDKGGKGSTQAKSPAQKGEKEKATRKTQDEARRLHIKNLLKDPKHKPKRPDADWRPPKPDPRPGSAEATMHKGKPAYHLPEASKKAGTAPYHPNDKSSGEIKVPKRKKQYSKGSGSPQKDPGFIRYTNSKDPHDRSYVRKEAFKDKDGKTRVAATSVYDARNMSYHAVNKLHGLEANPDYTYAEVVLPYPNPAQSANQNPRSKAKITATSPTTRDKPMTRTERTPKTGLWRIRGMSSPMLRPP